jgi:hypothetical protein
MLAKGRGGLVWTPMEWQILTDYATQAYRQAMHHGRSVVDRDVLIAVMQACEALRTAASQRAAPPAACASDGVAGDLEEPPGWTTGWTTVPPALTPEMGMAVCRQLAALVHDVPPEALPQCQARLAAEQATLLQLALRGYWYTTEVSILDAPEAEGPPACFPLTSTRTAFGRCLPLLAGHRLSMVLALTALPLDLALRTAVDWLDLVTLVECTQAAAMAGTVRTPLGTLTWTGSHDGPRLYHLTIERWQLTVSAEDFAGLAALVQQAMAQPDLRLHLERLAFVYGRI